jgi:hypothetical protein
MVDQYTCSELRTGMDVDLKDGIGAAMEVQSCKTNITASTSTAGDQSVKGSGALTERFPSIFPQHMCDPVRLQGMEAFEVQQNIGQRLDGWISRRHGLDIDAD